MPGLRARRAIVLALSASGLAALAAQPAQAGPAEMSAAVACAEQAAVVVEIDRNMERRRADLDLLGDPDMPRAPIFIAAYNQIAERFNAAQTRYRAAVETFNAQCSGEAGPALSADEANTLCAELDANPFCMGFGGFE